MGFWSGVMVGLGIGFIGIILMLFMISSGTLNKEEEAYRKGFNDGINSVKKENE